MVSVKKLPMVIAGAVLSISSLGLEPAHASHPFGVVTEYPPHSDTQGIQDYLVIPPGAPGRPAYYEASGGLDVPPNLYTVLASSEETGGDFNLFTFLIEPTGGAVTHTHSIDAETLFILDGVFTLQLEDQTVEAPAGSFVYLPVGRPHGFQNYTNESALALSLTTPGGLDLLFEALGVPATGDGPPSREELESRLGRAEEVLAQYGLAVGTVPLPGEHLDFIVAPPGAPGRPTFEGLFGGSYTSLATLEETGGEFSYSIFSLPSQSGLPALTQSSYRESIYILDGELTLQLGNQTTVATPGTYVYIPPDKPYAFTNVGTTSVRALSVSVTSVPESSSQWGLLGVGACIGAGLVRKRKHKKQRLANL
jgi:quercetin dioxygenase-like cupin family protein